MDCIDLDQDTENWLALVNAVINLPVPQNAGNLLTSGGTVICPVELEVRPALRCCQTRNTPSSISEFRVTNDLQNFFKIIFL